MAFATISLTNGVEVKKAPLGYSWTTFFFGGWPAIFRQDWLMGIGIIVACLFTWGIAGVVMSFIYNKIYAKGLFEKGYWIHALPTGTSENDVKNALGLIALPEPKTSH